MARLAQPPEVLPVTKYDQLARFLILTWIAQFPREQISERTKERLETAMRQGRVGLFYRPPSLLFGNRLTKASTDPKVSFTRA